MRKSVAPTLICPCSTPPPAKMGWHTGILHTRLLAPPTPVPPINPQDPLGLIYCTSAPLPPSAPHPLKPLMTGWPRKYLAHPHIRPHLPLLQPLLPPPPPLLRWGHPGGWLAGASQHALAEDTTPEVTHKLFQLNTLAPITLTQALLPHILQPLHQQGDPSDDPQGGQQSRVQKGSNGGPQGSVQGGCHVVVVGSMAGKVPSPGQAVYSGCKTALMGYFASLSTELSAR